jgi:hypothetical protein
VGSLEFNVEAREIAGVTVPLHPLRRHLLHKEGTHLSAEGSDFSCQA